MKQGRSHGWLTAAVLLLLVVAGAVSCGVYWLVPYEPGLWHQLWTITVTHDGRSATSTGFLPGRCGEHDDLASLVKGDALARACFSVRLCPGDSVCDCTGRASVSARCASEQGPGRTRFGDQLTVPVH